MEHLVIIIDKNGKIEPKKYSCNLNQKTKDEAIKSAKKAYELAYKNFEYNSYHFTH